LPRKSAILLDRANRCLRCTVELALSTSGKLRASVVLGAERTMEQDPLFAFRILVHIAIKALSKAINDPTTAVLAIDQLHRLLRSAGRRNLRTDQILDRAGNLRVIFRTPNWEDFVHLAFSEEVILFNGEDTATARAKR
jgi:uncharacterized membrane protein